ncbi:type II-A CRISPR-associated protein Csn2, partial [Lactobacillus kalixensis]|uniref:type II-A CRISPR-associated protein Csn2 n=2 Tax=Lactobacillus kalixensis TaxID=227944 RepID=UPI00070BC3EF
KSQEPRGKSVILSFQVSVININDENNWIHLNISDKKQYFSVLKAIETENNKQIQIYSENYDLLDISKKFNFIGNPIVSYNINEQYIPKIRKWIWEQVNPIQKEQFQTLAREFAKNIERELFLLNLPVTIDFEADYIYLLKAFNLHIEPDAISEPYDIIYLIMKLHSIFNSESILCLNDLANYLDENELKELKKESSLMKIKMILIN